MPDDAARQLSRRDEQGGDDRQRGDNRWTGRARWRDRQRHVVRVRGPSGPLVCVHQASPACRAIKQNRRLCVNVLRAEQAAISDRFAGRARIGDGDKFAGARWRRLATGAPALEDALVAFDCTVMQEVDWNTHTIFIAEVVDVDLTQSGSPLIYADRTYGRPLLRQPAASVA
jgi:flavin reductase (DIM6/NTAB) family NADH-FMN oxidoreductase RutF